MVIIGLCVVAFGVGLVIAVGVLYFSRREVEYTLDERAAVHPVSRRGEQTAESVKPGGMPLHLPWRRRVELLGGIAVAKDGDGRSAAVRDEGRRKPGEAVSAVTRATTAAATCGAALVGAWSAVRTRIQTRRSDRSSRHHASVGSSNGAPKPGRDVVMGRTSVAVVAPTNGSAHGALRNGASGNGSSAAKVVSNGVAREAVRAASLDEPVPIKGGQSSGAAEPSDPAQPEWLRLIGVDVPLSMADRVSYFTLFYSAYSSEEREKFFTEVEESDPPLRALVLATRNLPQPYLIPKVQEPVRDEEAPA